MGVGKEGGKEGELEPKRRLSFLALLLLLLPLHPLRYILSKGLKLFFGQVFSFPSILHVDSKLPSFNKASRSGDDDVHDGSLLPLLLPSSPRLSLCS